ncbi:MAG: hypothetical protein JNL11_15435 [Bdellovibrionaceae bacterium]|nr:hypothetical protein [Pseudobdellovibrionaceae bacterium]
MENFNFISEFENAIKNKNSELQISILKKALEEKGFQSPEMSELAGAIANYNLPLITLLEAYCNANPDIPHMAEVRLADYYASKDRMDDTTARARQFLSKLRGSEGEKNPSAYPVLLNLMARSYLLLTAAYTHLGARSYSQRVLRKGLSLPLAENFEKRLSNEIQMLETELQDADAARLDQRWEDFFQGGENFEELHALCVKNQFPQMAKRLELLHDNFRFNTSFQIDDAEILKDIFILKTTDDSTKPIYELY